MKFLNNRFYADINLYNAKTRLNLIDSNNTGYISNYIWSMEDDEFEYDLKKCGTDIDTNDSSIICKDDDYPLSDTSFSDNKSAVENMNQRGNGPETGGRGGESDSHDISEDFVTLPVNSRVY